jgi:hypothetical protein
MSRLILLLLLAAPSAHAMGTTNPVRWNHQHVRWDATGTGLAVTPAAATLPKFHVSGGLTLHLADRPFVLETGLGDDREPLSTLIDATILTEIHAALGFGPVDLGLVLPVAPAIIWGEDPTGGMFPVQTMDAGGIGDLVFVPKIRLVDPWAKRFGLALQIPVSVPTGMPSRYLGDGLPTVSLDVVAQLLLHRLSVNLAISPLHLRPAVEYEHWKRMGSFDWKAGIAGGILPQMDLRVEGWGSVHWEGEEERSTVEGALTVALWPTEFLSFDLGVGTGMGLGVPRFRAMAGIRLVTPQARWPEPPAVAAPVPVPETPAGEAPPAAESAPQEG